MEGGREEEEEGRGGRERKEEEEGGRENHSYSQTAKPHPLPKAHYSHVLLLTGTQFLCTPSPSSLAPSNYNSKKPNSDVQATRAPRYDELQHSIG